MLVPLLHLGLELDDASATSLALAPPLRVPCDASDTRPRSLCDTPAHKTATDILSVSYPTDSYATPLGRLLCIRLQQASMACVQIQGCYSTRHTPLRRSVCSSRSPRVEHGGQVVIARGHGEASHANCRHGAGRCSMAGTGGGGRILENPRRCVSPPGGMTVAWQCFVR